MKNKTEPISPGKESDYYRNYTPEDAKPLPKYFTLCSLYQ